MGTGLAYPPVTLQTGKGQNISICMLIMEPTSSQTSFGSKMPWPHDQKTQNILKSKFLFKVHFSGGGGECMHAKSTFFQRGGRCI